MRTRSLLPRPEYPRPDRQRSFLQGVDWLNLNGAWEFRFDADDRGRDRRWFDPDGSDLPRHPAEPSSRCARRADLPARRTRRIRLPLPRHDRMRAAWRSGEKFTGNHLRLRFLVPRDEQPQGGLTLFGDAAGRYPLGPTVTVD